MVKIDPLNVDSHNVAVCKNISTTLNEDLLYLYGLLHNKYYVGATSSYGPGMYCSSHPLDLQRIDCTEPIPNQETDIMVNGNTSFNFSPKDIVPRICPFFIYIIVFKTNS
jgi:hypothetical protein